MIFITLSKQSYMFCCIIFPGVRQWLDGVQWSLLHHQSKCFPLVRFVFRLPGKSSPSCIYNIKRRKPICYVKDPQYASNAAVLDWSHRTRKCSRMGEPWALCIWFNKSPCFSKGWKLRYIQWTVGNGQCFCRIPVYVWKTLIELSLVMTIK